MELKLDCLNLRQSHIYVTQPHVKPNSIFATRPLHQESHLFPQTIEQDLHYTPRKPPTLSRGGSLRWI